ncbi:lipopolysaccharide biosynthesis protein [Haloferax sp. ATB1]|uniref:lipopolysaccharide biosynthesis protein n=1 Tax=Haloferax sp. ATB1 TaxID=1508454 RepID=UPI000AB4139D|nr:oligosaccharide flippase family protein [Haloferax sp. ATB1]
MKRNMVTAFLSIFGGRIFIVLSSVVLTPLLITTLGFELYGRYGTLTAVFGISTILMSSGINSGARKFLAEDRSISDWQTHVFGYYFRLGTVLAVLTALAFAAAARFGVVTRFLGPEYVVGFYGLAGLTIATQFREYARRSLMGLKQEHLSEPLRVLNKVGTRLALIGIAYLGYEIGGLMVGLIVVNSLVALLALWWVRKNVSLRGIVSTTPRGFPTKELFSFNHLSVVYMLFLTSMYHVDVLMLASHVTETRVGYYKSALVISQFLWVIPRSIQSMLVQSVSDLWADERIDQINEIASRVTRYGMLVIVLLSLGLAALAKDFVPLYLGSGSMPVVTPLLILLPGTIGFAVVRPILAISHAKADMKPLIAATGAAAVLNIVLNVVLIPRHGILGAAVATTTRLLLAPGVQPRQRALPRVQAVFRRATRTSARDGVHLRSPHLPALDDHREQSPRVGRRPDYRPPRLRDGGVRGRGRGRRRGAGPAEFTSRPGWFPRHRDSRPSRRR